MEPRVQADRRVDRQGDPDEEGIDIERRSEKT